VNKLHWIIIVLAVYGVGMTFNAFMEYRKVKEWEAHDRRRHESLRVIKGYGQ
jgi:hypothetical protein